MPVLARSWQMLLKGLDEVRRAPRPLRRPRWRWSGSPMSPSCRRRPCWRASWPAAGPGAGAGASQRARAAPEPSALAVAEPAPARVMPSRVAEAETGPCQRRSPSSSLCFAGSASRCCTAGCTRPPIWCVSSPAGSSSASAPGARRLAAGRAALRTGPASAGSSSVTHDGARRPCRAAQAQEGPIREEALRNPLVKAVMETFPGAEIGAVREGPPNAPDTREQKDS